MSSGRREATGDPADRAVRDRIVSEFDRNFLVQAGAGSGKTHSLAMRMAAGVEKGHYTVEGMAAVTFTRKAAAELRGRFQLALEERLRSRPPAAARQRLETAVAGIERLFAGTIHAFCAHLLRERPVDAGIAPGFVELDDVENVRQRERAWRGFVTDARARAFAPLLELLDAGIKPPELDAAFAAVCEHEDVIFDPGQGDPPDGAAVWREVDKFWKELSALKPAEFHPQTTCAAQAKFQEFGSRIRLARRERTSSLGGLLTFWGKPTVRQKYWGVEVGREAAVGKQVATLVEEFHRTTVEPYVRQWRAYLHRLAMVVLTDARDAFARDRRRLNLVNYVDLLRVTEAMLRRDAGVCQALQRKYRWLFIDEFQDTDPIQAEIFLMLATDETGGLRPGALFVVGDPKQSIYRFRRADIDVYNRVARRIVDTGGAVLSLTANFRSRPAVCRLANTVFPRVFGAFTSPYSPPFVPLDPVRDEPDPSTDAARPGTPNHQPSGVAKLTVPDQEDKRATVEEEARRIAAWVQAEVAGGRRQYGDFLVLTRNCPRLPVYASAFDALEIPVEVSGAGRFCESPEVVALAHLLNALADPLDSVALVGVLRGPLFGVSDPELFQYRQAGGRFELHALPPEPEDAEAGRALDATYGPALEAVRRLRDMWRLTRRLPLAAAVEDMLDRTGWLSLAATTPGGARAGHLLQAIDEVRQVVESGGGLADAAEALTLEVESADAEALPLEPGRRDVVRLMNLHKAKGLEAPVVVLADPLNAYEFPVVSRVEREGEASRGHLRLVRKREGKFGVTTLAQPMDWEAHEAEETKYLEAERARLWYVAGTRAGDLLVVCRLADPTKNKAWAVFEPYLVDVPEIDVPAAAREAAPFVADVSGRARAEAQGRRAVRHERQRVASWAVATPTGEKSRVAPAAGPDSEGRRVDSGAAWGSLLHGLLEHAMRHRDATRDDLDRLARWLTVETPDLRPVVPEALDWVEDVRQLPFWQDASASGERHVEVPFAVRLPEPDAGPDLPLFRDTLDRAGTAAGGDATCPVILRGVIDLVHAAGSGWRVLDYKSDRLEGLADADAALRSRYGPQVDQYCVAWERAAGGRVLSADLVALRTKRTLRLKG